MLTRRGYAVLAGAFALWVASRLTGSGTIHMAAVGLAATVPLAALLVRFTPSTLELTRRPSARRAFPGSAIRVRLEVRNTGRRGTGTLLLHDRLPPGLHGGTRVVVPGLVPLGRASASYTVVCGKRGRHELGPLVTSVADPFDLARRRVTFPERHEIIVHPVVEDLGGARPGPYGGGGGESAARQLLRSGEDFFTMRRYEIGDDLRRIHWPSTARTGVLMIREHEAARRAQVAVFLDTRRRAYPDEETFERAVSAAASLGCHYLAAGFTIQLVTPNAPPRPVDRASLLDTLAVVRPSRAQTLTPALRRLSDQPVAGAGLAVVVPIPGPEEIAALTRLGGEHHPRVAVLVNPRERQDDDPVTRAEIQVRGESVRGSLARAGWEVAPVAPGRRLKDAWLQRGTRTWRPAAGS